MGRGSRHSKNAGAWAACAYLGKLSHQAELVPFRQDLPRTGARRSGDVACSLACYARGPHPADLSAALHAGVMGSETLTYAERKALGYGTVKERLGKVREARARAGWQAAATAAGVWFASWGMQGAAQAQTCQR